jgi:CheY-like chemotaxis protein
MNTSKFRIIVAEDEPLIREILSEVLLDEGYDCTLAVDGQEAAETLAKEKFDLLICDFRMPRMDGPALLEWCRAHHIHLPVIFITANSELLQREELALKDCCAALLAKPIDFIDLFTAIEDAKKRHHARHCDDSKKKKATLGSLSKS